MPNTKVNALNNSIQDVSGVAADAQRADTIVEAGSAIDLVVGTVADGEYLKRVGSTFVGSSYVGTDLERFSIYNKVQWPGSGFSTQMAIGNGYAIVLDNTQISRYELALETWTFTGIPAGPSYTSSVAHSVANNRFYYMTSTRIVEYEPITATATLKATLPVGFSVNTNLATDSSGDIYAWLYNGTSSALYKYSISGDTWTSLGEPGAGVYGATKVGVIGTDVYVCIYATSGGQGQTWKRNGAGVWSRVADCPQVAYSLIYGGMTSLGGYLYAVCSMSDKLVRYDPIANEWRYVVSTGVYLENTFNGYSSFLGPVYGSSTEIGFFPGNGFAIKIKVA